MLDRIRAILQARQLTPTQFADTIGVARPIVSHILGGRNKPSLEVVQKIIAAFPDLSMPWLLTGQGSMEVVPGIAFAASLDAPSNLVARHDTVEGNASAPEPRQRVASKAARPARATEAAVPSEPALGVNGRVNTTDVSFQPLPPSVTPDSWKEEAQVPTPVVPVPAPNTSPLTTPKTVRRVMIFYSDGTFVDYSPSPEIV
ncbi:helix-turn-helix transcriptional regulator [Hymenobacter koreensis]|uniref:helix-turn-helix domain-containing protein n=1 Tax=Hymenobacter koreensis TaxID=1084523 RepID=UPI0031F16010